MSANSTVHLIRRGKGWFPADQHAEEYLDKFEDGSEQVFERRVVRDPKRMRSYFAMLKKVIENTEQYRSTEELRASLLEADGWYEWRTDLFGRHHKVAKSMTEMDDDRLKEHFENALKLIEEHLGIDARELMREADGTQKMVRR